MAIDKSKRGWVRVSRGHPEAKQREALSAAGAGEIYVDGRDSETLDAFLASLRPRDTIMVETVGRLGKTLDAIRAAIKAIDAKRATLLETKTGRTSGSIGDVADMMADAQEELRRERRTLTRNQARKYGAMGNAKLREMRGGWPTPEDIAKALPIWQNTRTYPRVIDALTALQKIDDRWTQKKAYQVLDKRLPGLALGRPKKS